MLVLREPMTGMPIVCLPLDPINLPQIILVDFDAFALLTIQYHQRRNEAARRSHKKRFALPAFWIVPLSRMNFSLAALQT